MILSFKIINWITEIITRNSIVGCTFESKGLDSQENFVIIRKERKKTIHNAFILEKKRIFFIWIPFRYF